jgi:hypothetical protein
MANRPRTRGRSTSSQRKGDETRKAIRNILIVLALVGVVAFFYFRSVLSQRSVDEETACPSEVDGVTVLLVDVTDPMNTPQRQDFRNQLDKLLGQIDRYEKLVVVKVDPVGDSLLAPIITRCNPGSAKDVTDVDGNPQKLERQHREQFVEPMTKAFEGLMVASGAARSPVMESVQSVALSEFQKSGVDDKKRTLILASDLLQNTDRVSFYGGLPNPRDFVPTQAFQRVSTDLSGVEVELWMLQRDDSQETQPNALHEFWEYIINQQGGQVTRVYRVSG